MALDLQNAIDCMVKRIFDNVIYKEEFKAECVFFLLSFFLNIYYNFCAFWILS